MPPSAPPALALDQILPAGAAIPARSPDMAYRVRLALAAGMSLLVPLVYLALVVGLAWWSWRHLASMPNFDTVRGRAGILVRLLYISPSIAGFAAAGLLVSILFSRPSEEDGPLVLNRAAQPRLFALIERLCAAMGAPMPRRVEITAEPNASAARGRLARLAGEAGPDAFDWSHAGGGALDAGVRRRAGTRVRAFHAAGRDGLRWTRARH